MAQRVIEGTWEEVKRHEAEFVGHLLRVTIKPERSSVNRSSPTNRPSALGKYAFVAGGSEEFAKEKQAEIDREDKVS